MATITLLIDGDVEAFKAASVSQETISWGEGESSVDVNPAGAEDYLACALAHYQESLGADRLIVCLSSATNWRKELAPHYKANRQDKPRPELLGHCRGFLSANYETACWPRMEADDVMGILSSTVSGGVIVSVDKDMKTVPCRLYNPNKPDEGIVHIDDVMAHEWHMTQTLTGDAVDGYAGCPGIGPKKAAKIVSEVFAAVNPIRNYTAWRTELWKAVAATYEAKGLAVADALLNARLAYILRHPEEYNRETNKVRLWRPPA